MDERVYHFRGVPLNGNEVRGLLHIAYQDDEKVSREGLEALLGLDKTQELIDSDVVIADGEKYGVKEASFHRAELTILSIQASINKLNDESIKWQNKDSGS